MPDLRERSKRKKEAYQRDVEQKCDKYAKNQSDLSPDEQKKVADGCRVDGLAAYKRREQGCVIDTMPKHLFKGWRYDRCLERSKTQEPFDPERSVHQKANELRVEKQLTNVLDQLEDDQRLLNLKTFVSEGLPESMPRELLPPKARPASLEAATRPLPRPTAPESTALHRPPILDATPPPRLTSVRVASCGSSRGCASAASRSAFRRWSARSPTGTDSRSSDSMPRVSSSTFARVGNPR